MLIGIDPVISPELLDALFRMGHGDEIVLADAFFPGDSMNPRVIRAQKPRKRLWPPTLPATLPGNAERTGVRPCQRQGRLSRGDILSSVPMIVESPWEVQSLHCNDFHSRLE